MLSRQFLLFQIQFQAIVRLTSIRTRLEDLPAATDLTTHLTMSTCTDGAYVLNENGTVYASL